ncbi:MAG: beta strand repeat-containing protein, partial [Verrucomicrobiaceae bacterium]
GVTEVTITATGGVGNASNNSSTETFTVTVVDTTPPAFYTGTAHDASSNLFPNFPSVTVEAVNADGAIVDYTALLASSGFNWHTTDAVTPTQNIDITYSKDTNTQFGIGLTVVAVKAKDVAGNSRARSLIVYVKDRKAPDIVLHDDISVEPENAAGATVTYDDAQTSDAVGVTSVTYSKAKGTVFPVGVTTVTITAKDAARNTTTSTFTVTVASRAQIAVEQPVNNTLGNGTSTVDFGPVNTDTSRTLTFTIRSTGVTNLNNLSVTKDRASADEFTVTSPASTPLAPGSSRTFTVKFTPISEGVRTANLHIASNAEGSSPFDITLTGTGVVKPTIVTPPATQLVALGEPASLTVDVAGSGPPTYQWLKNGVAIAGATDATYDVPAAALSDGAGYSVRVTNVVTGTGPNGGTAGATVTSAVAKLGVFSPAAGSNVSINEGATLTLKASVGVARGTVVTYLWKKDGDALTNSGSAPAQVISGATTGTLSITKAVASNAGSYTCDVTMTGITRTTGAFTVTVPLKPVVNPLGPLTWAVSKSVTEVVTAQNSPATFAATDLPKGVTLNPTTGQLSGKPTTATANPATRTFTVTASNAAGTSTAQTVQYTVTALPAAIVGTFNGLVERAGADSLGGTLRVTTTATGAFSGTLTQEAQTRTFTGGVLDATAGGEYNAAISFEDALGATVSLTMQLNSTTGELTGAVTGNSSTFRDTDLQAWRNPWSISNSAATNFAGVYTASMEFADTGLAGDSEYPQGNSYGTLTITANTGAAYWAGKMADGTAVTTSTFMGPDGQVPLYFLMYAPTAAAPNTTRGSALGWVKISGATTHSERNLDTLNDGANEPRFDWYKPAQPANTTRSYSNGIPLHKLVILGSGYTLNANVVSLLGAASGSNNAQLVFTEGGIGSSASATNNALTQLVSINANNNTAGVPTLGTAANPARVTLTLNAGTGAISGAFRLS